MLTITAPADSTTIIDRASQILGVSLSDPEAVAGETFTVSLTDSNGLLSRGAPGSTSLTIRGSLAAVNAALAKLTDKDAVGGIDQIDLAATDSQGEATSGPNMQVTTYGAPQITAPPQWNINSNQPTPITGVSQYDVATASGELFTVTLHDTRGLLGFTDPSILDATISGAGTTSLTITGQVSLVGMALAMLTDTMGSAGGDTITIKATDSLGAGSASASLPINLELAPTIVAPGGIVAEGGQATAAPGVSLSDPAAVSGEVFTVTVSDGAGLLSDGGPGATTLTIRGSLASVNAHLAALTYLATWSPEDTITLNASGNWSSASAPVSLQVAVDNLPWITVGPGVQITAQGQATRIPLIAVYENAVGASETFTVTLTDTTGLFNATGAGVSGAGSTSLTLTGSLNAINSGLFSLTDTEAATGSDTISVSVRNSLGVNAEGATIPTATYAAPTLTVPANVTLPQAQATLVSGLSLSENNPTSGEYFTVNVRSYNGLLSDGGAAANSLSITGSLATVNADLAALTDTESVIGDDVILLTATNSHGLQTGNAAINVTVFQTVFTLTTGRDDFNLAGGGASDTFVATGGTLNTGDIIIGGSQANTLELSYGGAFDLRAPATLSNIALVTATEGAGPDRQAIDLRSGMNVIVNVASGSEPGGGVTIRGAADASTINLGDGIDTVVVGSASETVNGGGGRDTIDVTGATIGATIDGGAGPSVLAFMAGGTGTMGANITSIQTVLLTAASNFTSNGLSGLTITGSAGADAIAAGGAGQTLIGGAGANTLIGWSGGGDTFKDTAANLSGDTIEGFAVGGDAINVTNILANGATLAFAGDVLTIASKSGTVKASVTLSGDFQAAGFQLGADSNGYALVTYSPSAPPRGARQAAGSTPSAFASAISGLAGDAGPAHRVPQLALVAPSRLALAASSHLQLQ